MGKFEYYISNAFNYARSDIKKILIGGLLSSISGVFGVFWFVLILPLKYNINYSNLSPEYITTLIIFGFLGFLFSLIIGFLINGYYVRVMKFTVVDGGNVLPDWNDLGSLFIKGLLYFVGEIFLFIIFIIIPILVIVLGISLIIFLHVIGIIIIGLGIIMLITSIFSLFIYLGLAEVNYSIFGFLGFFEFRKIFRMINLDYILLIIIVEIIAFVINMVVQLPFITLKLLTSPENIVYITLFEMISVVLSGFVGFFTSIFIKRSISLFYKDRMNELKRSRI